MIFSIEKKSPERIAAKSPDGSCLTYGELCEFSEKLKLHLQNRRLVFCFCENELGALAGYIGAVNCGAVPLLLDAKLKKEQLTELFQSYRPEYIWVRDIQEAEDFISGKMLTGCKEYGLFQSIYFEKKEKELHKSLGLLLATSGSTGSPKLVRLSLENLESNARAICQYLFIDEKEKPITSLPMQYTYGLSVINSHLLAGACILMTKSSCVQTEFWEFFQKEKASSMAGVPYTYKILKRLKMFQKEIPSLHYMTQAGGRLSEELQEEIGSWAQGYGIKFYVMYGQTEATARMAYLPPEMCLKKPGSIGIAIPGGEFFLLNEKKEKITKPGTEGELIYRGENVSLGYARKREDLCLGDENHGELFTGDLAKMDEEGYFYITGRKKRFVKMYGIRVSLDECEKILKKEYPDADLACSGKDDNIQIFITKNEAAREAALFLADRLKLNFKGISEIYIEKIPRNSSGKVLYSKLQQ